MATGLNVSQETFGQLVRFALVGFFLAGVYSIIYWYLATYVMPPMAAVANAVYDAIGIRMRDLPISPPKLRAALDAEAPRLAAE